MLRVRRDPRAGSDRALVPRQAPRSLEPLFAREADDERHPRRTRRPRHTGTHARASGRGGRRPGAMPRARASVRVRAAVILALTAAVAIAAAAYARVAGSSRPAAAVATAVTRPPTAAADVLAGSADTVAARAAAAMFAAAPLAVVANAGRPADLAEAVASAEHAHVPLLLVALVPVNPAAARAAGRVPGRGLGARSGNAPVSTAAELRAAVRSLGTRVVLDVGVAEGLLRAQLPRVRVTTDADALPVTRAPARLRHVVLLVHRGPPGAGAAAAVATAKAAGVRVITVAGYDPRADPAAISALSAARPAHVLAVGGKFGPARRLAARIAVAETGVQLPGGGQVLFPAHRLLALYGYPGTPALGALGQQSLSASIARIRAIAASYRALSSVPVVPAFEIIATVAQGSPGPDGSYSYESPQGLLRRWVQRATAAGMYVILDLQPGRASLLAQARRYQQLLKLPNVGLAIDPEWKLQPGQRPLRQIGSVDIAEVNGVVRWLAGLTARFRLPQKLLVLHQFMLSMIQGERRLNTGHDDLSIVIHMDGQGTPGEKLQTWQAVTAAAPAGVYFGWKNFFVKDHPMLSPAQTMSNSPQPVMISYQ